MRKITVFSHGATLQKLLVTESGAEGFFFSLRSQLAKLFNVDVNTIPCHHIQLGTGSSGVDPISIMVEALYLDAPSYGRIQNLITEVCENTLCEGVDPESDGFGMIIETAFERIGSRWIQCSVLDTGIGVDDEWGQQNFGLITEALRIGFENGQNAFAREEMRAMRERNEQALAEFGELH